MRKSGNKKITGSVILEYMERFPNTNSLTIARKAYKENRSLFANVEHARTLTRYYRGRLGKSSRKHCQKASVCNELIFPDGEKNNFAPVTLPTKKGDRWLILSDIHLPYHDEAAIKHAVKFAADWGVNGVILNGDTLDCYQLSSFSRDPRARDFAGELDLAREFLDLLAEQFPKAKIYWKDGNHEERFQRYLLTKAPELLNIEWVGLKKFLELEERGVEYIDNKRIIRLGKLTVIHGHEYSTPRIGPANPARWLFTKAKEISICGHYHQTSEHNEPTISDKLIACWSTGCLCDLHPKYMPLNNWNHGFAVVEITDNDGGFRLHNKRILRGGIV